MTQLTALERDLLACVERLVTASEASAKDLTALETRSTGRIETELAGLKVSGVPFTRDWRSSRAATG